MIDLAGASEARQPHSYTNVHGSLHVVVLLKSPYIYIA